MTLGEPRGWTRWTSDIPSNLNYSVTSEQPVAKGTDLWGSGAGGRTASQKGWYLCLIWSIGSSTQTVGFKVHVWNPDLLMKHRLWSTAGFVSISYVWRRSPYFSGIEHDTIFSFWPSLIAGFDAAYEVDKRDRVLFFKGTSLNGRNTMLIFIWILLLVLPLIEDILNI